MTGSGLTNHASALVGSAISRSPTGPASFTGEVDDGLVGLVEAGTVRLIDVIVLVKDHDGTVDAMELSDLGDLGSLQALEAELAEFLAEEDVANLVAAMNPGSVAGVLVYENLLAAPFASAARRVGGQPIANGRVPIQAIIAAAVRSGCRRRRI